MHKLWLGVLERHGFIRNNEIIAPSGKSVEISFRAGWRVYVGPIVSQFCPAVSFTSDLLVVKTNVMEQVGRSGDHPINEVRQVVDYVTWDEIVRLHFRQA